MGKGEQQTTIDAAPAAVWAVAGDFAAIGDWFPGIESVELEGDDRVISPIGVRERMFERDDQTMTLVYGIVENDFITGHRSTIKVEPDGGGSKVTMTYEVEPDTLLPMFDDTYRQALDSLKAHLG